MIEINDLPEITQQELLDLADVISGYLREEFPDLDVSAGSALYSIVIKPAALTYALLNHQKTLARTESTLLDNTDDTAIDRILANLFIERGSGTKAKGLVNITLKSDILTSIPTTITFLCKGREYNLIQDYAYTQGGGSTLTIEVVAAAVGTDYNIAEGTSLTTNHYNIDIATTAEAFTNGTDEESATSVLEKAKSSFSTRGFTNKKSIESTLTNEFKNIEYIDIQGFGDLHQDRDLATFGVHKGSLIDIYLRTGKAKVKNVFTGTIDANILKIAGTNYFPVLKIESIVIDSVDIIDYKINRTNQETFHVLNISQLTSLEQLDVIFPDNSFDTKTASVVIWTMGDIGVVQEYVDQDSIRNLNADLLIKSVIPYEVDVALEYGLRSATSTLTTADIKNLISNTINAMNSGIINLNDISSNLFMTKVIVKNISASINRYDSSLKKTTEILNEDYKDYNDTRICFFAGEIKVSLT